MVYQLVLSSSVVEILKEYNFARYISSF